MYEMTLKGEKSKSKKFVINIKLLYSGYGLLIGNDKLLISFIHFSLILIPVPLFLYFH